MDSPKRGKPGPRKDYESDGNGSNTEDHKLTLFDNENQEERLLNLDQNENDQATELQNINNQQYQFFN